MDFFLVLFLPFLPSLVFAGAICKQILESKGISIVAHVNSIGSINDKSFLDVDINEKLISSFNGKELPLINSELEESMRQEVMNARKDIDRKSTRLNSSHKDTSRMPSSA